MKRPQDSYGPSASQEAVRARLAELEGNTRHATRVLVPANTPPEKIDALKDLLARKRVFDPAWNGERFEVATHEHECASVECDGEVNIDGAILLSAVNDLLFGVES